MGFVLFIGFLIALRLVELFLSRKNEKWLLVNGAVEYGRAHYPYIIALHILFIVSLVIEFYAKGTTGHFNEVFFAVLVLLLLAKGAVISTLGKHWTTRIYQIPGEPLVSKGIYKYFKHPNYAIVVAEIAVIPLVYQLYYTAVIFSVLNAVILWVRIGEENKALRKPVIT